VWENWTRVGVWEVVCFGSIIAQGGGEARNEQKQIPCGMMARKARALRITDAEKNRRDDIAHDESRGLRDYGKNYFRNVAKVP